MKEVSTNVILVLAGIAVMSVVFSSWLHFQQEETITGLAIGTVNVTVNRTVAILLNSNAINFTSTRQEGSRDSYTAGDFQAAPRSSCAGRRANETCGINLTNDGSVSVNLTMRETGTLFASSSYNRVRHFLYNVSTKSLVDCGLGFLSNYQPQIGTGISPITGVNYGVPYTNWTPVNTTAVTIVCGLNFTNADTNTNAGSDVAAIDINITVPSDEESGDKGTTLEILALYSGFD